MRDLVEYLAKALVEHPEPVSYTHLDVYKRQGRFRGPRSAVWRDAFAGRGVSADKSEGGGRMSWLIKEALIVPLAGDKPWFTGDILSLIHI